MRLREEVSCGVGEHGLVLYGAALEDWGGLECRIEADVEAEISFSNKNAFHIILSMSAYNITVCGYRCAM